MGTLGIYSLISTANQGDVSYNSPCKYGRIRAPTKLSFPFFRIGPGQPTFLASLRKRLWPKETN